MEAAGSTPFASKAPSGLVEEAREIMRHEGMAVLAAADHLPDAFHDVAHLMLACRGSVVVTGIGKAGIVGRKIAATLSSTGTRSSFLHPTEAVHGDLGAITRGDVVLALSYSGQTEEVLRLLPLLEPLQVPVIALTGHAGSVLAQRATAVLSIGSVREAGSLGLAPTTSTTVMLAVGDALALVVSRLRGFGARDFARNHPGGSLGRKLARVDEVMRPLRECRVAAQSCSVRDVFVQASRPGRRSGAIMLTDEFGKLTGIFTDSDLARLLERAVHSAIDKPIADVMTGSPSTIVTGSWMKEAIQRMGDRRISELPVIDEQGRPIGMIDITDVVGLWPKSSDEACFPTVETQDDVSILPFPQT